MQVAINLWNKSDKGGVNTLEADIVVTKNPTKFIEVIFL